MSRKFFLFIAFLFIGCIKPQVSSVVDNSLFETPYKAPFFVGYYSNKYEKRIGDKLSIEFRRTFNNKFGNSFNYLILDSSTSADFKDYEEELNKRGNDIIFKIEIEKINLYGDNIISFSYLLVAYDHKIKKEVWKSRVFSPYSTSEVKNMTQQVYQKLINDGVINK